jgi:hypothetical protein
MRPLSFKPNTAAPDSDFPYGRIKDRSGSVPGTKVNEEVYGDIHQFFEKLMDESGITPNNLPDNEYSGFQLFEALSKVILNSNGGLLTKIVDIGDWDMDTNAFVNVSHGLSDFTKIRSISVVIRDDTNSDYRNLLINNFTTAANNGGSINLINSTVINLSRINSGFFDDIAYDSTSFNRGWITIQHLP